MSDVSYPPPDTSALMPRVEAEAAIAGFEGRITALEGKRTLALVGNLNVSETLLVSLSLGMKRKEFDLTGVALTDKLVVVPNGAPTAGCEAVNAYPGSSANKVSIGYYTPALGIAATYSIPVTIYKVI